MRPFLFCCLLLGAFAPDPLPADLASVTITATGTPTSPYALVHLFKQDGFKGYALVDGRGAIVWHYRTKDYPFGAARRKNGNFVFMDKGRGLVEVNPRGEVVHELAQRDPEREMHHDLIVTPADTVMYIAFDTEDARGKRLKGEAIWEWNPDTGEDVKRWRSWDFLSPIDDVGPRTAGEWLHANSLAIGPRGNVIMSFHYINQVISITKDWKSIEWRLGGIRPTIPLTPDQQFSGQHTAREIAPGRIVLFDNGRDRGGYSRAMELSLENGTGTPKGVPYGSAVPYDRATTVWQWRPEKDNYSSAISSARRLPGGNTLVSFGMSAGQAESTGPTEAFEVTNAGKIVWHLSVSGTTTMFRVEPIASWP
jgi:hypothetical protein